jgi:hypothetical protein
LNKATTIQDPQVKAKLRRHLKDISRKDRQLVKGHTEGEAGQGSSQSRHEPFAIGRVCVEIDSFQLSLTSGSRLMQWNSPFGPLSWANVINSTKNDMDQISTPPGLTYNTPPSCTVGSPQDPLSPMTVAIKAHSVQRNTKLLIQGKFDDFIRFVGEKDKRYNSIVKDPNKLSDSFVLTIMF